MPFILLSAEIERQTIVIRKVIFQKQFFSSKYKKDAHRLKIILQEWTLQLQKDQK